MIKLIKRGLIISSENCLNNIDINNIEFVILRIGFTDYNLSKTIHKDINFENNYKWAHDNKLYIGLFYESRATSIKEAKEELEFIIDLINNKIIDYPIIISFRDDHNTVIYYNKNHKTISKNLFSRIVDYTYNVIKKNNYIPIILTKNIFLNKEFNKNKFNILLEEEIIDNVLYLDIHNLSK